MQKFKMFRRSEKSLSSPNPSLENSWDPLKAPAAHTLSNGNKTVQRSSGSSWVTGYALKSMPVDRKSAYEMVMGAPGGGNIAGFSVIDPITAFSSGFPGQNAYTAGLRWTIDQSGTVYTGANITAGAANLGKAAEFSATEVLGVLYDPATGRIYLRKNGMPLNAGAPVWTVPAGRILTPSYGLYQSPAKVTIQSGIGALKYKYDEFSVDADGGIVPGQGTRFFNAVNKHANLQILNEGRTARVSPAIGSYSTSFVTEALPGNKKTVFEFIVGNMAAFSLCGMFFGADRTGPKTGVLGQTIASSLGLDLFSSGGGSVTGNGCTRTVTTIGTLLEGDVLGFGYDPVAKTVVMWKNGVALNSGNPIWTGVNSAHADGGIMPGISMYHLNGCVRLNPDLPSYNYGDYTN